MKAIFKDPLKDSKIIDVENSVAGIQKVIGGYFEAITIKEDACILCDEEGKIKRLKPNCIYNSELIVGPVLVVGVKGEDFTDVPERIIERWKKRKKGRSGGEWVCL